MATYERPGAGQLWGHSGDDVRVEMDEKQREAFDAMQAERAAAEEQALLDDFAKAALTGLLAHGIIHEVADQAYAIASEAVDERKRRMEAKA